MRQEDMVFYCNCCNKEFTAQLFGIDREYNKVQFEGKSIPEVSIRNSETVAEFCSHECRSKCLVDVMQREQTPISPIDFEPVERCARCSGPVDATDWHLTYVESTVDFTEGGIRPLAIRYLAVVCKNCDEPSLRPALG